MKISLEGRTAIITGGSRGLGLATARRLVEAGADTVIAARDAEVLDQAVDSIGVPDRCLPVAADVSTPEGVELAHQAAVDRFGPVDIVINNAGTSRTGPFEALTDETLAADLDLKLFAAVRLIRLALPGMKERRWGRIINVLSVSAKAAGANSTPTSISRASGLALTKALASELGSHNVLVNALLVGLIESDQHHRAAQAAGLSLEDHMASRVERVPMGRIGNPEEFANLACFLVSDAAGYINGTAINVDGGLSPVP